MHERGFYMGIFTLFLTNGPHVAPLMGGFIAQYIGWEWCFRIPGFIQLGSFVITLFCLPETLYCKHSWTLVCNVTAHLSSSTRSFVTLMNTPMPPSSLHLF